MSISVRAPGAKSLTNHPLYISWYKMMYRCYGDKYEKKHRYVDRGIYVCDGWHNIENFIADMYPSYVAGLTLDRSENSDIYCKANCKWISREENSTKDKVQGVGKYTLDGKYLDSYSGCSSANISLGLNISNGGLNRAIQLEKPYKGFRWSRTIDQNGLSADQMKGSINNKGVGILQLDLHSDTVIKRWKDAKEVVGTLGINSGSLSRVCQGKLNQTGGFKWKYAI